MGTELASLVDDLEQSSVELADRMLRRDGSVCPPAVHLLSRLTAPAYLGSVATRPFYPGPDAAAAVTELGLLPSVLCATQLVVVWEYADLSVALELGADVPSGLVVLDASMSSHTVRWHPLRLHLDPGGDDGRPAIRPEWGQPVRHEDVTLPGPVMGLLALWHEWRCGDAAQTRAELASAGFHVTWAADLV